MRDSGANCASSDLKFSMSISINNSNVASPKSNGNKSKKNGRRRFKDAKASGGMRVDELRDPSTTSLSVETNGEEEENSREDTKSLVSRLANGKTSTIREKSIEENEKRSKNITGKSSGNSRLSDTTSKTTSKSTTKTTSTKMTTLMETEETDEQPSDGVEVDRRSRTRKSENPGEFVSSNGGGSSGKAEHHSPSPMGKSIEAQNSNLDGSEQTTESNEIIETPNELIESHENGNQGGLEVCQTGETEQDELELELEGDEEEESSGRKMFVGGLSWQTGPDGLRDHFGKFGQITEVMIMNDPATRRSR